MRMSKFTCNHSHLFDCVTEMSTKCRKARVRISVGLREYEVRSNPYYALHQKKLQLSGNEHKVPKGTGANFRRIARVRSTEQSVLCAPSKKAAVERK